MHQDQVDGKQAAERERQHQDVDPEEPAHRVARDVGAAAQQQQQLLADDRHAARDLRAHDRRPVGALVPGQEVAGEAEAERHHQEQAARRPR